MTSDLDHLTDEERKVVLEIYPKEIKDLEQKGEISPNVSEDSKQREEKKDGLEKVSEEQKEDWKSGYVDYEKKTKDSDRVVYEEGEIELTEEDLE